MTDMDNLGKKFILNPNTLLVTGATRSLICDIDRSTYLLIPNILSIVLSNKSIRTINEAINTYASNEYESMQIVKYFDYLMENDLIIFTDCENMYTHFEPEFYYPGLISNAIVEINSENINLSRLFVAQLSTVFCRAIQLRFYNKISYKDLIAYLQIFDNSIFEWIEVIIEYSEKFDDNTWSNIQIDQPRVKQIILYDAPCTEVAYRSEISEFKIIVIQDKLISHKCCGVIGEHYFAPNIFNISEAFHFNSCLNLKISMDIEGNIKNCPSMRESFGNILNTKLNEVIENPGFKKYWHLDKSKIHVCKDCEFRYICTDCRAYIEDPKEILSKPLKCGYNPYLGEWSEWSLDPLKQNAIAFYDLDEIVNKRKARIMENQKS